MDTRHKQIYKRNCDICGKYYEGRGQYCCSRECANHNPIRAKKISSSCKAGGNMAREGNGGRFEKGLTPWNKDNPFPQIAGAKNVNWRGGRFISNGYVYVLLPSHPRANKMGYVCEHRLVMEKHIGRYLRKEESVHHIDGDKSNNIIENLQLFATDKEHLKTCHRPSWLG